MTRVIIISHDLVADRMAGVGIRYYEIACALSPAHDVTLAAPQGSALPSSAGSRFKGRFVTYDPSDWPALREEVAQSDVLFAYPDTVWLCRELLGESTAVVVDGYDLALLEHLELDAARLGLEEQLNWQRQNQAISQFVLRRGDLFLCATGRQRDWWLGALASASRVNPLTRLQDPSFSQLIDLLPYGIPEQPPAHTQPVMRGVLPGISPNDKIVLWGGGVWQWLDPLTLVRAADLVSRRRPDVKFVFPGVHHPAGQLVPRMEVQQQTLDLARSLNLLDRSVFLGEWVAYEDWQNYLVESDVGVSLHRHHLEAYMSSRTRVLSYVWGGLPMVLTRGDELADLMAAAGVAQLVGEQDEGAVAEAVLRAINLPRGGLSGAFDSLRSTLRWDKAVSALDVFCASPHRAHDAGLLDPSELLEPHAQYVPGAPDPAGHAPPAVPPLSLPKPATPLSRAIEPLVRSLGLWYLATVVEQQNRINQLLQAQLERSARRHDDLQKRLADVLKQLAELQVQYGQLLGGEGNFEHRFDAMQEALSALQERAAALQQEGDRVAGDIARLARQGERFDVRLGVAETLQTDTLAALAEARTNTHPQ